MANQRRTAGFMESLGLISPPPRNVGGSDRHSSIVNTVRSMGGGPLSQLIGAAAGGVASQFGEGEGNRLQRFMAGAEQGQQAVMDGYNAKMTGLPVQEVINRRKLAEKIQEVKMGQTPEQQLNGWTQIAELANKFNVPAVAANAMAQRMALRTQIQQQRQAGLEIDEAEIDLAEAQSTQDLGKEVNLVSDPADARPGKGIRIDRERAYHYGLPETAVGKWMYIDANGNRSLVDGVELRSADMAIDKFGRGGIAPKDDNVIRLAHINIGGAAQMPKVRGMLDDMATQAEIVTEVSGFFESMTDPEFMLDLTGKAAIQANRWVRFGENAAQIIATADGQGRARNESKYTWNGKDLGTPERQHQVWMQYAQKEGGSNMLSTLNTLRGEAGFDQAASLAEALPQGIKEQLSALGAGTAQIARYAEQYWANVMELAYMDARLKEPSNRGLSDKDIENALRRIGAATASPASFAQRQLTLIRRVGDAIDGLGSSFTVPPGAQTRVQDVVDFVYNPRSRYKARDAVDRAEAALSRVYEEGIRSEPFQTEPGQSAPAQAPAQPGEVPMQPEDYPGFDQLSPQEQQEFRELWKISQATKGAS